MALKKTSIINMSHTTSGETVPIEISGTGPLSIQPIRSNITGSPTYTLEVSNSKELDTFVTYNVLAEDVDIANSIQINHEIIPWKYIRLLTTAGVGGGGTVYFNVTDSS